MVFRSVLILIATPYRATLHNGPSVTINVQVQAPYRVTLHKPFRPDKLTVDCIVYPASYL